MPTVAELRVSLRERGMDPRDVDLLIADVTGRSRAWVLAHGETAVDAAAVEALAARRLRGEPMQYIRGRCDFFGREYVVDERVLIPRPETELLVETAIMRAPRGARVVDVGAGSGCVAISLERARTDLDVIAVDVSFAALAVAARNARLGRHRRAARRDRCDRLQPSVHRRRRRSRPANGGARSRATRRAHARTARHGGDRADLRCSR
jgi:release factor glutamine methyltransferase